MEGLFELILRMLLAVIYQIFKKPIDWVGLYLTRVWDWFKRKLQRRFHRFYRKPGDPIRHSRGFFCLLMFGALFSAGLGAMMWIFPDDASVRWSSAWWLVMFLSFFMFFLAAVSVFITIYYMNMKIFLADDHFLYKTFLRKPHQICYRSIRTHSTGQSKIGSTMMILHTDEKTYKINIDSLLGIDELCERFSATAENVPFRQNTTAHTCEEEGDVFLPSKWGIFFGIGSILFGFGFMIWAWLSPDESVQWWVYLFCVVPVVWGIIRVVQCVNLKICLKSDHLIYRTALRNTHQIPYGSIRTCTENKSEIAIYTDEKTYKINIENLTRWDELYGALSSHIPEMRITARTKKRLDTRRAP